MPTGRRESRGGYVILVAAFGLAVVAGLLALEPPDTLQDALLRGSAWLGYLAVFCAIASSAYMRQMSSFFGRSFIRVHHVISVTGLIMITLHPLIVALRRGTLDVFIPVTASWRGFLVEGGRAAWYLLGIASLAALLRQVLGRVWHIVHALTYPAFGLASAHIILRSEGVHALVAWTLAMAVAVLLVHRYLAQPLVRRRRMGRLH